MESAFSQVVEDYADFAYNVAYRMLHNVEDAEDAVQEAFISAYRAFPRFKGESKVSTWLYRIVVNSCLMKIRKEKSRAKYLVQTGYNDDIAHGWTADPEQAAITGELRDVVESELGKLSPDLRATVVMRDVQGLTTEESAEALGLSITAFKSRLHRGRVLVRKGLEVYLVREK
jgi:RNA polymerase sigma-70 factor (ECF subfamily)